jgi:hypothetical protein
VRRLAIKLKGCPRCGGDLFPEYDVTGTDLICLQCGYIRPVHVRDAAAGQSQQIRVPSSAADGPTEVAA